MSEINKEIKSILEKEPTLLAKLKSTILKFTSDVPAPVVEEKKEEPVAMAANVVELANGTKVSYEGELAVGTALSVVAEDGTLTPAPDGSHELANGDVVVTMGGLVESITPKAVEPVAEQMMADLTANFEAKFSAQEKMNSELVAKLQEQNEALKTTLLAFEKIINAPVVESVKKVKAWEEMTSLERRRATKHN